MSGLRCDVGHVSSWIEVVRRSRGEVKCLSDIDREFKRGVGSDHAASD